MASNEYEGEYVKYSPLFPNFFVCAKEMTSKFLFELMERIPMVEGLSDWLKETWEWHYTSFYWSGSEVGHVLIIAILLSLVRYLLSKPLESIPRSCGVIEHDVKKFPESAWKFAVYGLLWLYTVYIAVVSDKQYFFRPTNHWNDWAPGVTVPTEIYWLYMFQMGLYVHCVYATVFIDVIRKDFIVMMVHHFLTLALLTYSMGVRFHVIGLVILLVQDFGDISLEISKCIFYFKIRHSVECKVTDMVSNVSFAIFTVQWIVLRLYWFPTKVLYSTCYVSVQVYPSGPFYLSFNVMLILLYFMQVYWFSFIVRLLIKMVFGGEGVKDTRETEEEEKAWKRAINNSKKNH